MDIKLLSRTPLRLELCFHASDTCFYGHFPDNPVVPGSLIIGLCLWGLRTYGDTDAAFTVKRFAFERFAAPGMYELRLDSETNAFACTLTAGDSIYARGTITC